MGAYELNLKNNLRIIFKRIRVVFYVMAISMFFTYLFLSLMTPMYKSEVRLLVGGLPQIESPFYDAMTPVRTVDVASTISEVIRSRDFIREVIILLDLDKRADKKEFETTLKANLKGIKKTIKNTLKAVLGRSSKKTKPSNGIEKSIEDLSRNIRVESVERTDVIRVMVYDYNPEMAAKISDKLVKVYLFFNMSQQGLEYESKYGSKYPKVVQIQDELKKTRESLLNDQLGFGEMWNRGNIKVIGQAYIPTKPANVKKKTSYVICFILSFIMGVILMYLFEILDPSFRSTEDAEREVILPFFFSIPHMKRLSVDRNVLDFKGSGYYDSYEEMAAGLYLRIKEGKLKEIAITSVDKGAGRTTVAKNLALLLSKENNLKTLLIDVDFRDPALHLPFNISESPGLTDILSGRNSWSDAKNSIDDNLDVITVGESMSTIIALSQLEHMGRFLEEAKQGYEIIILDLPILKNSSESLSLCRQIKNPILVVKEGVTNRDAVKSLLERLKAENIQFTGLILNDHRRFIPGYLFKHV